MTHTAFWPLAFAVLVPFAESLMNLVDKFVMANRVRNTTSFIVLSGGVNLLSGIVLALCLDWSAVKGVEELFFPALVGVLFGSQHWAYYRLLRKEDASKIIGIIYLYPIVVAILSFAVLGERFPPIVYAGVALVMSGAWMLSGTIRGTRDWVMIGLLAFEILMVALHEFFIKVATNELPALHGLAVTLCFVGLTLFTGMLHRPTLAGIPRELRNVGWMILGEGLQFVGLGAIYLAMAGLPATIVATIGATQPLIVLLLERSLHFAGIKICTDLRWLPKLIPIMTIVGGLVILNEFV